MKRVKREREGIERDIERERKENKKGQQWNNIRKMERMKTKEQLLWEKEK